MGELLVGNPGRKLLPPLSRAAQPPGGSEEGIEPAKAFASAAAAIMVASPKRRPRAKRQSFGGAQPGGESGMANTIYIDLYIHTYRYIL